MVNKSSNSYDQQNQHELEVKFHFGFILFLVFILLFVFIYLNIQNGIFRLADSIKSYRKTFVKLIDVAAKNATHLNAA